jgi:hypothetical protein
MSNKTSNKDRIVFEASGHRATYLRLHGFHAELVAVLFIIRAVYDVPLDRGPIPCGADNGCYCADLVVVGDFPQDAIKTIADQLGIGRYDLHVVTDLN